MKCRRYKINRKASLIPRFLVCKGRSGRRESTNLYFFDYFLFRSIDIARVNDTDYVFVSALYMGNGSPQNPLASTPCITWEVLMSYPRDFQL